MLSFALFSPDTFLVANFHATLSISSSEIGASVGSVLYPGVVGSIFFCFAILGGIATSRPVNFKNSFRYFLLSAILVANIKFLF